MADGEKRRQANVCIGKMSKGEAEVKKRELLRDLDNGNAPEGRKRIACGDFFTEWLANQKELLANKTHERYASVVRLHVVPVIGRVRLAKVSEEHIEKVVAVARGKGLSEQTTLHIHRLLHTAFAYAFRRRKRYGLPENVVKRVVAPSVPKRELKPMRATDVRLLIQAAQGTRLEIPVAMAAVTGLRRSELLALRWSNTDLDRGAIFVAEALEHTRQVERVRFKGPKSPSSRRRIPIAKPMVDILKAHRLQQEQIRQQSRAFYSDNDLVFPNPDGTPWPPDTLSVQFAKLAKLVGLQGFRFHDLRHAFATLTLADGRNFKEVQGLMGHSTAETTLNIYAHQVEGAGREAVESLTASLFAAG
jgi:integrase